MVTVDTTEFDKSLDSYIDQLKKAFTNSVVNVMQGTAEALTENTPIGDPERYFELYQARYYEEGWDATAGMLMANWYFELNATDGLFDSDARDTDGSEVKNSMRAVMQSFKLGDSILVTNETPYAPDIEAGQSKEQQPEGMLKPTVDQLMAIHKIQFKDFLHG